MYVAKAHAPSSIIEAGGSVDVYHVGELTGSKNRTFEFFLVNDMNTTMNNVNVTVAFGDGKTFSNTSMSIGSNIMFLVQNNYSRGGDYKINITVNSTNGRYVNFVQFINERAEPR